MCIPQMFAAMSSSGLFGASTSLQSFGTFISAISSLAQGVAGMQAADAQAKAYENQAKVKEAQATQALEKAQMEARLLRERGDRFKGTQFSEESYLIHFSGLSPLSFSRSLYTGMFFMQ